MLYAERGRLQVNGLVFMIFGRNLDGSRGRLNENGPDGRHLLQSLSGSSSVRGQSYISIAVTPPRAQISGLSFRSV
jgi:hypothetical protein